MFDPVAMAVALFFSRGYQLFCRQDCSFPAVLCNSKWTDHKFAVSCFVKGRSALNYSLFLKRKYSTGLRLSPCLHNCSWDLIIFGLFGSAQSLFFGTLPPMATEEQGISSNPMQCQTRFSIYSSLSMLFIHDIFLSTQKIVPHIKFSKLNQCIQLLWPIITAGLDDVYTHRF